MPYRRQYTVGEVRAMIDALCEGRQRNVPGAGVGGAAAHMLELHWAIQMTELVARVTRVNGNQNAAGQFAPRIASSFHTVSDAITAIHAALNSADGQAELHQLDLGDDSRMIRFQTPFNFYRARRMPNNINVVQERGRPGGGANSRVNVVVRRAVAGAGGERLWIQTAFPDEV